MQALGVSESAGVEGPEAMLQFLPSDVQSHFFVPLGLPCLGQVLFVRKVAGEGLLFSWNEVL